MALPMFFVPPCMPAFLWRECSWRTGDYVTDGERLFRVLSPLSPRSGDGMAELEECATGEPHLFTARKLWALSLRRVSGPPA